MTPPGSEPPPRPNSRAVRSLGICNVILGLLLFGVSLLTGAVMLLLPTIGSLVESAMEEAEQDALARRQLRIDGFRERIEATDDPAEQAALEAEITLLEMEPIHVPPNIGMDFMSAPSVQRVSVAEALVMAGLNLMLLVSGFGLWSGRRWGRSLALAASGVKIPALIGFAVVYAIVVAPRLTERWSEEMGRVILVGTATEALEPEAEAALERYGPGSLWGFAGNSLVMNTLGLIYPIFLILMLQRPSVRAALERPEDRS